MSSAVRIASLALTVTVAAGCAPRFRHDVVGSSRATIGRGPALAAIPVSDASSRHIVALDVWLPRAVEVEYIVDCPGHQLTGVVGETWDHYRERRIAELRRQRGQQVRTTGAVVGAVTGAAGVGAEVVTPGGEAYVEAGVDGRAAGELAADAALPEITLDPRDTGAQRHQRRFELVPEAAGQCTAVIASAHDGQELDGIVVVLDVERVVDVGAERAAARARARDGAIEVRGGVRAGLVAGGADPEYRAKRARARAGVAIDVRADVRADLIAGGADPDARAKAAAERERLRRQQAEERARIEEKKRKRRARVDVAVDVDVGVGVGVGTGGCTSPGPCDPIATVPPRPPRPPRPPAIPTPPRPQPLPGERALTVRGEIVAWFVAGGCDPHKRERDRAEEARRAEQERLRLIEEDRAARRRLRLRAEAAFEVRGRVEAWLIAGGADPEWRRKQHEAEIRAHEERVEAERYARTKVEADRHAALEVRGYVKGWLIGSGAIDRTTIVAPPPSVHVEVEPPTEPPPSVIVVEPPRVPSPPSGVSIDVGIDVDVDVDVSLPTKRKKSGGGVKRRDHRKRK